MEDSVPPAPSPLPLLVANLFPRNRALEKQRFSSPPFPRVTHAQVPVFPSLFSREMRVCWEDTRCASSINSLMYILAKLCTFSLCVLRGSHLYPGTAETLPFISLDPSPFRKKTILRNIKLPRLNSPEFPSDRPASQAHNASGATHPRPMPDPLLQLSVYHHRS